MEKSVVTSAAAESTLLASGHDTQSSGKYTGRIYSVAEPLEVEIRDRSAAWSLVGWYALKRWDHLVSETATAVEISSFMRADRNERRSGLAR